VVIAGGVSGGIWKSTDRGRTWKLKTSMNTPLSVTWIAQDPRNGQSAVWYYVSGEQRGSGSDLGGTATFFGNGIYKSTDNGETWQFLSSSADNTPNEYSGPFDFVSKVAVSPINGNVYIASDGFGIYRSTNGSGTFSRVIGTDGGHQWSDIAVADSSGVLVAVLSSENFGVAPVDTPGVYKSVNHGDTWTRVTPATFPSSHSRSVITIAPSNRDLAYVLTSKGDGDRTDVKLHKIVLSSGASTDLSANIPDFGNPVGYMDTQLDYNMAIALKPNDPNFVLIGGINLFRSTDGFATKPTIKDKGWVGGYATVNDVSGYENHHADQHALFFDPFNSNMLWSGHDGGISRSHNISAEPVVWEDMNSGYNVTQFYTVALAHQSGKAELTDFAGGTQDNGTPVFDYTDPGAGSVDISSGDGAFVYLAKDRAITSAQEGQAFRIELDDSFVAIAPPDGHGGSPLFIHPFAVDPGDEKILFYPLDHVIWRNGNLGTATTSTG